VKHIIPILVILLLLSSGFVDVSNTADELIFDAEEMDDLAFYCYDAGGSNAKYEYYKEQMLKDNSDDDIDVVEDVVQTVESSPYTSSSGPMDSPWPMFCHDVRHTGRSPYGMNGKYLMEKWRFKLAGHTAHSPIIDGNGTIYICATFADAPGCNGLLQAINPDGTEKWRYITYGPKDSWINHVSPAIASDGTVYFGDYQGYLYAINPNSTLKWKTKLKKGIFSSPAIEDDGTVYIGAYDKMCAVNPNGTVKWMYNTGEAIRASPAIGDDGTVYVSSHDGYFYAFYPNNGTLKWKVKIGGYIDCYSSPAIGNNGTIYIGGKGFYAFYPNGTVKWKFKDYLFSGSPIIGLDGTIYTTSHSTAWAFYPNGELKWERDLEYTSYSLAISNTSIIYFCAGYGDRARVYLLSPTDGCTVSNLLLEAGFLLDGPAIGPDGTVYVGSWNGYLHAIEVKEHAPDLRIEMKGKFARLKVDFKNVGDVDASNIEWDIYIEYYGIWCLQVRNLHSEGTFPILKAGEKKTQFAWPIFLLGYGFAEIDIWVNAPDANPDKKEELWLVFGPFIFPQ